MTDREAPKAILKYRNRTNTSMSLGESRQLGPSKVIVDSQRVSVVRHICLNNTLTLLGRFKLGLMRRSQRPFHRFGWKWVWYEDVADKIIRGIRRKCLVLSPVAIA